jgi:hypothetical protein
MSISDVLAVPREKVIHFPNDCHSNVKRISDFIFRDIPTIEIKLGEFHGFFVYG